MSEIKLQGSAPAEFSITEYLKAPAANTKMIAQKEKEVSKHIKSFYTKDIKPNYSDWYAGITDKIHNRYKLHEKF